MSAAQRPRIGITSNFGVRGDPARPQSYLLADYSDAIYAAGGLPLLLAPPPTIDAGLLDEILRLCDGLLLTGGLDLPPESYGEPRVHAKTELLPERRARFDLALFQRADAARLPMLSICLGHQIAHVARGGALVQHIDDLPETRDQHHRPDQRSAFHAVRVAADSRLARIVGAEQLEVNSRHHQAAAPTRLGQRLRTVAVAADGTIEASEDCDGRFLMCVQWHPEELIDRPEHLRLFEALVAECRTAGAARERAATTSCAPGGAESRT